MHLPTSLGICVLCTAKKLLVKTEPRPDPSTTFQIPPVFVASAKKREALCDKEAVEYLTGAFMHDGIDPIPQLVVPYTTTGDGNCLVRAVGTALWGMDEYHPLLRSLVHSEMSAQKEWYQERVMGDWDQVLKIAETDGQALEYIHVQALSNAIRRPIVIFAGLKDTELGQGGGGAAATILPLRLQPDVCTKRPVFLSWNHESHQHFVPLLTVVGSDYKFTNLPRVYLKDFPPTDPSTLDNQETLKRKYILVDEEVKPPKLQEYLESDETAEEPMVVQGWVKELNPDDQRYYDLVLPIMVGSQLTFFPFDFTEQNIQAEIQKYLLRQGLHVLENSLTLANRLWIHVQKSVKTAVHNSKLGTPPTPQELQLLPDAQSQELNCSLIPNVKLIKFKKSLPPNFKEKFIAMNFQNESRYSPKEQSAILSLIAHLSNPNIQESDILPLLDALPIASMLATQITSAFPVLDIFRLLLCFPNVAAYFVQRKIPILDRSFALAPKTSPFSNQLLALRLAVNALSVPEYIFLCESQNLWGRITGAIPSPDISLRAAVSALLVNLATVKNDACKIHCITSVCQMLDSEKDERIALNLVVAAGTLIQDHDVQTRAKTLCLAPKLKTHTNSTNPKLAQASKYTLNIHTEND
ncbi:hypothetical protein Pelo_12319 [Pelomyxa schiedti]|nr:hypothetical protein Pelo_12319 [Pelomyxa schiedti]